MVFSKTESRAFPTRILSFALKSSKAISMEDCRTKSPEFLTT